VAKAKDRRRNANAGEYTVRQTESLQKSGLARWSRRKAMARAEQAVPPRPDAAPHAETAEEVSAIEKTDADMPAIDSLNGDSDYSVFLSPKVSEKLRRTALRKLFHLPQYNFRDELDFCNGDFRNFTPMGNIITADMRYHMEREINALKERLTAETDDSRASEMKREINALKERLTAETDDKRVTEKTSDAAASETPVSESNPAAALPKESVDEPTPKTQTPTMDKTKKG
jgi:hypothetical protein